MARNQPRAIDQDRVDVVLYVTEDPQQEGDIEALLDMYFEFFTHQLGWHRLDSGTAGSVLAASFHRIPTSKIKEVLSKVDWGKRAPAALIKNVSNGLRSTTDVWTPPHPLRRTG